MCQPRELVTGAQFLIWTKTGRAGAGSLIPIDNQEVHDSQTVEPFIFAIPIPLIH